MSAVPIILSVVVLSIVQSLDDHRVSLLSALLFSGALAVVAVGAHANYLSSLCCLRYTDTSMSIDAASSVRAAIDARRVSIVLKTRAPHHSYFPSRRP
jgi:hypothetical protein